MARLVLASGSPRRRELLGYLGLTFEIVVSDVAEDTLLTVPEEVARRLAERKALAVAQQCSEAVVLAADTVVAVETVGVTTLLAKPADLTENCQFLHQLSGKKHQVFTGVSVWSAGHLESEVALTEVYFRQLAESEIAYYAATGEGLDKAGGYAIQGRGAALVSSIVGEYSNVVGLPLSVTLRLLREQGIEVWGA